MTQDAAGIREQKMASNIREPSNDPDSRDLGPVDVEPQEWPVSTAPGPHLPERTGDAETTRRVLAYVLCAAFSLASVLVVIGGLIGKFDQGLVDAVFGVLGSSTAAIACFYFRSNRS
jgi:hypothetical protein